LHIIIDKIAPELPTKAPVTINKSLPKVNPEAAAAHPDKEFSIEITTGISAPPIAITKIKPKNAAIAVIIAK